MGGQGLRSGERTPTSARIGGTLPRAPGAVLRRRLRTDPHDSQAKRYLYPARHPRRCQPARKVVLGWRLWKGSISPINVEPALQRESDYRIGLPDTTVPAFAQSPVMRVPLDRKRPFSGYQE